ncbi:protein MAIN-LIKE 2-like [Arachis hypogaea]|uniref:protein MAIN-LIKE 2-like n=1 Tax=Arachis hypogaea TaxID=3818 RepID=UPI003B21DFEF
MGDDSERLYRLDEVAHITGSSTTSPSDASRACSGSRACDSMSDEPLVSAFVERWRPKTHTFHMSFRECTITLQDVAYQLGLPVDGRYVSGCLTDFQKLLGVSPPANQIQKFAVNCTWFHETFGECPAGADEETVRHFARAYIMLLLGTQLFADKFDNRIHIRWLPYVVRLEEMCGYSWGSAALAWLYRCMCRVANRHVVKLAGPLQLLQSWIFWRFSGFRPAGYDEFSWPLASRWSGHNPSGSEKGPRVQMWKLRIDMLQLRDLSGGPSGCASEGVGASSYGLMAVCDGTDIFCHRIVASD